MPRTPKNQDVEEAMPPKTSRERRAAEAKLAVSLIAQVPPLKTSTTNSGFPRWQSAILDVAYNQGWDDAILSTEDWDPEAQEDELEESDRRVAWMVLKATTQEFSYLHYELVTFFQPERCTIVTDLSTYLMNFLHLGVIFFFPK